MTHKLLLCSLEHNSFILAKGREQLLNFLGRKIGFLVYSQVEKDAKKKRKKDKSTRKEDERFFSQHKVFEILSFLN